MSAKSLKTVERTLALLKLFSRETPEMTVADIVRRSDMARSVVQRIIVTLESEGFLERCPDSLKYRVGIAACELGALFLDRHPLVRASDAILRRLADETSFSVYLGTRTGSEVTILALHEGDLQIRFLWSPGDRLPIATTALGKAMLMHCDRSARDAVLGAGPLPASSSRSIRSRAELESQLEAHRERGWITAFEESLPGIYAIGAAVLDAAGAPVAGISVSFLRNEAEAGQVEAIGRLVLAAAGEVSAGVAATAAYAPRTRRPVEAAPPSARRRAATTVSDHEGGLADA